MAIDYGFSYGFTTGFLYFIYGRWFFVATWKVYQYSVIATKARVALNMFNAATCRYKAPATIGSRPLDNRWLIIFPKKRGWSRGVYPLVIQHSYWTWPFRVRFLIRNGDFPQLLLVYQRVLPHLRKQPMIAHHFAKHASPGFHMGAPRFLFNRCIWSP